MATITLMKTAGNKKKETKKDISPDLEPGEIYRVHSHKGSLYCYGSPGFKGPDIIISNKSSISLMFVDQSDFLYYIVGSPLPCFEYKFYNVTNNELVYCILDKKINPLKHFKKI